MLLKPSDCSYFYRLSRSILNRPYHIEVAEFPKSPLSPADAILHAIPIVSIKRPDSLLPLPSFDPPLLSDEEALALQLSLGIGARGKTPDRNPKTAERILCIALWKLE